MFPLHISNRLVTNYEQKEDLTLDSFGPLPALDWIFITNLLFIFAFLFIVTSMIYISLENHFGLQCESPTFIAYQTLLGITEPIEHVFFRQGVSGNMLMTLYAVFAFMMISLYNVDFRAYLIGERFEQVPDTIQNVDLRSKYVIFTLGSSDYIQGTADQ